MVFITFSWSPFSYKTVVVHFITFHFRLSETQKPLLTEIDKPFSICKVWGKFQTRSLNTILSFLGFMTNNIIMSQDGVYFLNKLAGLRIPRGSSWDGIFFLAKLHACLEDVVVKGWMCPSLSHSWVCHPESQRFTNFMCLEVTLLM